MCDILFPCKDRLEFTRESFAALTANTDWSLVDTLWIYDDGSTDGTREWLRAQPMPAPHTVILDSRLGAPAAIMNDYLMRTKSPLFAKVDNDVIVPPGWLNACMYVMDRRTELDLLGIEPPESRTPHYAGGKPSPKPELETQRLSDGYAKCDSIGGVGLMRRRAFLANGLMSPHSIYGGFTEWQLSSVNVVKGWITPPLRVFLLDRLPGEPWASLSRRYIANKWQRAWSGYDPATPFWDWWMPKHMTRFGAFDAANERARRQDGGRCVNGHARGQRGCALCEDLL